MRMVGFAIAILFLSGKIMAAGEVTTYVIENPDGATAVYVNGSKVSDSPTKSINMNMLAKPGGETSPSPTPTPTPKGCGDMECPKPQPSPTPDCRGPFCPGGTPFFKKSERLIYYRNDANIKFPNKVQFKDLPSGVRNQLAK